MGWYACEVRFDFDMDDGERYWYREETRRGAYEADDADAALATAERDLRPWGPRWGVRESHAEECRDAAQAEARIEEWERD